MKLKAKVQDASWLATNRKRFDKGGHLMVSMFDFSGQEVSISSVDFYNGGVSIKVEEDKNKYSWKPWMFKSLPRLRKPISLPLLHAINNDRNGTVFATGAVKIACQTISAENIEHIYKASQRALNRVKKDLEDEAKRIARMKK